MRIEKANSITYIIPLNNGIKVVTERKETDIAIWQRIFFMVGGYSTVVDRCSTNECFLYRYGVCKNRSYQKCEDYHNNIFTKT